LVSPSVFYTDLIPFAVSLLMCSLVHRTTKEEMEGPASSWGLRNRKHAQPFMNVMMMICQILKK